MQSDLRFKQVDSSPKVKAGHQLTGAKTYKTAKELKILKFAWLQAIFIV